MTLLQLILLIVVSLLGWPIGKFIARKTKEELKAGKKWFKLICIGALITAIVSLFIFQGNDLTIIIASCIFIFLLALAALKKK